jgi:hypothetical protein
MNTELSKHSSQNGQKSSSFLIAFEYDWPATPHTELLIVWISPEI